MMDPNELYIKLLALQGDIAKIGVRLEHFRYDLREVEGELRESGDLYAAALDIALADAQRAQELVDGVRHAVKCMGDRATVEWLIPVLNGERDL